MLWGYLAEFWEKITDVIVGGTTYTIAWFEGIGNAVAGAVGSLFEDLIHHLYDIFYIAQYLIDNLQTLFGIIFTPLVWVFNFTKGFFVSAFQPPGVATISWVFPAQILEIFNAIPYWSVLMFSLGAGISVLILIFIFKRLTSI